jgi:signal transduction histidine kinase
MSTSTTVSRNASDMANALRFTGLILGALALALAMFYGLMLPPMSDLGLMTVFLSITAALSIAAGYIAYRQRWIQYSPRLALTIFASCTLSSLLTFINVWLTARLMFASQHDLMLATVLLFFAGGISIAHGWFFAQALTVRIDVLEQAAEAIGAGQLGVRVPVNGRDEMTRLARTFNQMADQLQAADAHQRQLDRLRRDLLAWISHDLQTPLASVRVIVEALADDVIDDEQTRRRYLRTAQRDIQALSGLIDDLFQMSQIDAGGLQLERIAIPLEDLISDTLESFTPLAHERGITLGGNAGGSGLVTLDPRRLGRALANLISNALRHTPAGGRVTVTAERRDRQVHITVADTGEGIAADDLPHIFDRFYRGDKARSRTTGGAGLGLAITRGIVEAHRGQITCDSTLEEGTTFTITLPATLST